MMAEYDVTPEALIKREENLRANRTNWETMWQELATYILPSKADFNTEVTPGTKRAAEVYDSTAVHANQMLAASLHGSLTSPASQWFYLRFRDDALDEDSEAKEWLQECEERMFLELSSSNFNAEVAEAYQDLIAFGTAALLQEDVDRPDGAYGGFNFKALHLGEVTISENAHGVVDTVFRKLSLTARQAYEYFGDDCGDKALQALEKDPDKAFDYLQAVFPRQMEGVVESLTHETDPLSRPFACYYVSIEDKKICKESGYYEMPILVPRWAKTTGDVYGFGPGCIARADIHTLNDARKLAMKAWEKAIDPPLLAQTNGIIGTLDLRPSSLNFVRDINGIREMPQGTNWNADQLNLNDVRASVRRIFFSDQLELQDGPQMTATEVEVRYELMQRLLGPTLGRLQSEFLTPLVERCFYAMARGGAFEDPPDAVLQQQQAGSLDIEYIGPLARSQKAGEVTSIQRLMGAATQMAQVSPEALDLLDLDEAVRVMSDRLGVPAEVIRGQDEVDQIRQGRQEQMAQQQQMAQEAQTLDQAQKVADIRGAMHG